MTLCTPLAVVGSFLVVQDNTDTNGGTVFEKAHGRSPLHMHVCACRHRLVLENGSLKGGRAYLNFYIACLVV
jgi:hypothetical protein